MKIYLLLFLSILVLAGLTACSGGDQGEESAAEAEVADQTVKPASGQPAAEMETVVPPEVETCRAAAKKLGGELKSALQEAMADGGPLAANGVCNEQAEVIARRISEEEGLTVGRTSLKIRNPANVADGWERATLAVFAAKTMAGESPQDLETWTTVTDADGGRTFRYLKGIPTGPLCLQCHGGELAPDLDAKLTELYPADQARGFSAGDLRGAFTVQLQLPRLEASGG